MQKEEFINIATRVSEGIASDAEMALFLFHVNSYSTEEPAWEFLDPKLKANLKSVIEENIFSTAPFAGSSVVQRSSVRNLWIRVATIAAAISAIVIGIFIFKYVYKRDVYTSVAYARDIKPGRVGATLTLENGKKIKLADAGNGEIAKQAGISVFKTLNGQLVYEVKKVTAHANSLNTLTTARGETYQVILPDKSKVWLNAASSLTYYSNLNDHGKRRVKLDGEAYFEVAKDIKHPFIVESRRQQVEVLGTHFNIDGYDSNEQTKTTLLQGSVKVSGKGGTNIIKPGQQAILSEHNIQVTEVEPEDAIAWKNGYFMFDKETLEVVMQKISRWYDVQVIFEDPSLKNRVFLGTISKYENISKVLNMLGRTEVAAFKIEGKTIRITDR